MILSKFTVKTQKLVVYKAMYDKQAETDFFKYNNYFKSYLLLISAKIVRLKTFNWIKSYKQQFNHLPNVFTNPLPERLARD